MPNLASVALACSSVWPVSVGIVLPAAAVPEVVTIVEFEDDKALDVSTDRCLRYVNHSCGPNTYLRRVNHRVELYSLRRIRAGEELTCDYGETHHEGQLPCRCGSPSCRSRI